MRKTLFFLAFTLFLNQAAAAPEGYVDPIKFQETEEEKAQVIEFIKKNVDQTYCKGLGQCSATMLRMMEEAQLKAFKQLAKDAKEHPKQFKQVYKDYCIGIGQCDYSTLSMMFNKEVESSAKQLTW